jgi:hypothetical protein
VRSSTIIILLVLVGGWLIWQQFIAGQINLPNGDSMNTTTTITEKGEEVTKDILETEGVKHSVPLDEIRGGGPPQDGIPPIDKPKFISISNANNEVPDDTPGIAIELNGENRFYPFNILVWHEIVNDTIGGQRMLVTYCPLCFTGIVFDPMVNGERVEFGTSGKLWNSNLVMYDRQTDSLWSQVLGEAIVGEKTGTKLELIPSDLMKYAEWKKLNPNGTVLSQDTGISRDYERDPYGDYYTTPGTFFPVNNTDDRLEDKAFVLGIEINGQTKAYVPEAVKQAGRIEEEFAGTTVVAEHDSERDVVRIYEKLSDGTEQRIDPFPGFWFSWVSVHPETELYN